MSTTSAPRLTPVARASALRAIKQQFQDLYVFPELRPAILARLDESARAGRYDTDDPALFADRITHDLKDVAHDEHLALSVDPAAYAAALLPPKSDVGEDALRRTRALRRHHGVTELRVLSGNVRYAKIIHFDWVPGETAAVYDDAMRFLKDGNAWILDLRGNGGGSSPAASYLLGHFLEPGTVDYISYSGSAPPESSKTLEHLPAGTLRGKPLYVLVDGSTGSAAEAVAYDLQQFKVARIVGAKTAGAANNNKLVPVAPEFILSVSYGRPIHVLTKTNWEGVGVAPSVPCDPAQALDVSEAAAIRTLAEAPAATPEDKTEYAWALVALDARVHSVTRTAAQLEALAGRYGAPNVGYGEMDVAWRDGALVLLRANRPPARLTPLTEDGVFAIEGSEQLRARFTGKALELLWWDDPQPRVFVRR